MAAAFVLLDTETTGAGETDRICQLAFLALRGREEPKAYMDYCKPPVPISFGAMSVHHITPEMVENAPSFHETEAARALAGLNTPENIAVIHNAPFDLGMLAKEDLIWQGPVIDTYRCIRHLQPDLESHALQQLRYALGFYREEEAFADRLGYAVEAHDAMGDVIVLHFLMSYLLERVGRSQTGVQELIALTLKPIFVKTFRFGKYKGSEVRQVFADDNDYFQWAVRKMDSDPDLSYTLKRVWVEERLETIREGGFTGPLDKELAPWALAQDFLDEADRKTVASW